MMGSWEKVKEMIKTKTATGTPEANGKAKRHDRPSVPGKQTLGRALAGWLGNLTLVDVGGRW